jgi:DSF synthase
MDPLFQKILRDREQFSVRYDSRNEAIWVYGNPKECPCLDKAMFDDFYSIQLDIIEYFNAYDMKPEIPIKFFVCASHVPDVYSYGGELFGMIDVIEKHDRESLEKCAKIVIDTVYLNMTNLGLPLQTITLLEGDALGGGLYAALSYNAIIAEEQVMLGMQQIRFNMCPGVGAYGMLAHKVGMNNADRIILSTELMNAREFYEIGGITEVAKRGEGKRAVDKYMKQYRRSFNAMQTLHAMQMRHASLDYAELEDMASLWVESLLRLDDSDIARIKKIAEAQKQKIYGIDKRLRTKQDRRFMQTHEFPFIDPDGNVIERDRRTRPDPRMQGEKG